MKKILFAFISLSILQYKFSFAQTSPSPDAAQIQGELEKLNVLGSVLYIAAHPDDENTRLLAYLANEKHYRTGYLSLTRGDGGQNLIGNEQGEELGLIRTQELLAARRVDGAEQFFTRAFDFGYTKNPEETFLFWDKEKILSDVVFVIRKFQPDIIIMRFPTTGEGGHGQHTASAILAEEAFAAAADPNRFPEQLQYVKPWQAKRLMWNTFNFGGTNTTSEDQFKLDVGVYNPLLGKSYGEIAAESRSNHKSQGFGVAKSRGSQLEYFKTISGDAPQNDLMDGVNTSWSRIQGTEIIQAQLDKIISAYQPKNPSASVPGLVSLYSAVKNLPDDYWKFQKLEEIKKLIVECAALWFEAYSGETTYCEGEMLDWKFQVINRTDIPITLSSVLLNGFDSTFNFQLMNNQVMNYKHQQPLDKNIPITQPYWLAQSHSAGMFVSTMQELVGEPKNDPALEVKFSFRIGGVDFDFDRPLVYKTVDPAKGEIYSPLVVAPPVTASLNCSVLGFNNSDSKQIKVLLNDFLPSANGSVKLITNSKWKISPAQINFSFHHKGDDTTVVFNLTPPSQFNEPAIDTVTAEITVNGEI
ncbi:MAG: PIG-L family deacetylase, partial [Chitinophagales bacterium]